VNSEILFKLAEIGDISVLSNIKSSIIRDHNGRTPLHIIAMTGSIDVLKHEDVDKLRDDFYNTPLHYLALSCNSVKIKKHAFFKTIRNAAGFTPHDLYTGIILKKGIVDYDRV